MRMRRQAFYPGIHTTQEIRRPITITLGALQFDMTIDDAEKLAARLHAAAVEVKERRHHA